MDLYRIESCGGGGGFIKDRVSPRRNFRGPNCNGPNCSEANCQEPSCPEPDIAERSHKAEFECLLVRTKLTDY